MRSQKLIVDVISALLILLWVYAAVSKLIDYRAFRVQLGKSPLIESFAGFVSVIIPLIELGIAFLLARPKKLFAGLWSSLFLLMIFTIYLIGILSFSHTIPCSCGGIIQNSLGWKSHIVFNIVFAALAATGILLHKRSIDFTLQQSDQLAT